MYVDVYLRGECVCLCVFVCVCVCVCVIGTSDAQGSSMVILLEDA